MQIHIESEPPNELDAIAHNVIENGPGFSVDLFYNLGDETGLMPPTGGAEASERKRRIGNGRDGFTSPPAERTN